MVSTNDATGEPGGSRGKNRLDSTTNTTAGEPRGSRPGGQVTFGSTNDTTGEPGGSRGRNPFDSTWNTTAGEPRGSRPNGQDTHTSCPSRTLEEEVEEMLDDFEEYDDFGEADYGPEFDNPNPEIAKQVVPKAKGTTSTKQA